MRPNTVWLFARFLAAFAFVMTVWHATPLPSWYERAELAVAAFTGPVVHGWVLEPAADDHSRWRWQRQDCSVNQVIELQQVASGVVPLLALVWALPQIPLASKLRKSAAVVSIHFVFLAVFVITFPIVVFHQNALTDIAGARLRLVPFVAAPALMWCVVCWNALTVLLPSFRREPKPAHRANRNPGL